MLNSWLPIPYTNYTAALSNSRRKGEKQTPILTMKPKLSHSSLNSFQQPLLRSLGGSHFEESGCGRGTALQQFR